MVDAIVKNHFIAMLSGTDPDFPTNCWDLLIPKANISLNLLRASRIQPKLSAYALIHGAFDYNRTPLGPPGCKIAIHDRAGERRTWAEHASRTDISDMYLCSQLEHPEFVKFKISMIPEAIIQHYGLRELAQNGYVYARIKKAWYGLKQSGKIAHDDLVTQLSKHGYHKSKYTEGLFTHETRQIAFTLRLKEVS